MNWTEGWYFEYGDYGWSWARLNPITGEELVRSGLKFKTLIECVQHARLEGLLYYPPCPDDTHVGEKVLAFVIGEA